MSPQNTPLDEQYVRSFFPALSSGFVYMDNAGGSQTLKPVVDRISEYLFSSDVQLGASYSISQLAAQRLETATRAMALYMNAANHQEIVMGPSASMLIRILAICLGRGFEQGDEIIVSGAEHEANASPWVELQDLGMTVKFWPINADSLLLEQQDLAPLMTSRTRLVAFTHCSNVIGAIHPARQLIDFIHSKGALACVDGVAYAPHRLVDVQALDADFYIFSYYKVFGPHHAVMYGKKHLLEAMPGFNHYFIDKTEVPYKFQPGNVNYELSYGMLGLVDYLKAVSNHHLPAQRTDREHMQTAFDLFAQHEAAMAERLLQFLTNHPKITVIGPTGHDPNERVSTLSFVVDGQTSDAVARAIDPYNIGLRYGDFYAKKLAQQLGLTQSNGVVRASLVHYNTVAEVDQLCGVLEKVI